MTKLTTLQLQQTPTTTQPETLPNPRAHPSHGKSIKTRWENIRKYFAKKVHSQLGHFLSKELHYLIPHLKTNERPVKTVSDLFHEKDEETLTLDDVMNMTKNIKEASTSRMNSTSTVQFQTENQKQERNKKVEEQQFSNKIIPPKDINYIKNADKLNKLEKKSMQVAEKAMEGIQGLISTTSDKQQYDDYLISVRQSLMYIPERNLLPCTNGILTIIDSYISK